MRARGGASLPGHQASVRYSKVRYRGLAKNTAQLHTLFALANIWMVRRKLLPTG